MRLRAEFRWENATYAARRSLGAMPAAMRAGTVVRGALPEILAGRGEVKTA